MVQRASFFFFFASHFELISLTRPSRTAVFGWTAGTSPRRTSLQRTSLQRTRLRRKSPQRTRLRRKSPQRTSLQKRSPRRKSLRRRTSRWKRSLRSEFCSLLLEPKTGFRIILHRMNCDVGRCSFPYSLMMVRQFRPTGSC